jgi:hypothetical protein
MLVSLSSAVEIFALFCSNYMHYNHDVAVGVGWVVLLSSDISCVASVYIKLVGSYVARRSVNKTCEATCILFSNL